MQDKPQEPENGPRPDEGMLFNRMLKSRTVLVSGEINKPLAERVIRSLILLEERVSGPIKVYIDSPGGDADAGYAIFDMMRFVKPKITMIGMGLVASAAAIIILAAPRELRVGLPNSHYLIHQPMSGTRGVATEIEIHAKEIEKLRAKINRLIADETGQPHGEGGEGHGPGLLDERGRGGHLRPALTRHQDPGRAVDRAPRQTSTACSTPACERPASFPHAPALSPRQGAGRRGPRRRSS